MSSNYVRRMEKALDKKDNAGAILTDLSKAFDSLNHDLLIAKLNAYGFDKESLEFIRRYLKERKQRTKVGPYYSTWKSIKLGVPQDSILGPCYLILLSMIYSTLSVIYLLPTMPMTIPPIQRRKVSHTYQKPFKSRPMFFLIGSEQMK